MKTGRGSTTSRRRWSSSGSDHSLNLNAADHRSPIGNFVVIQVHAYEAHTTATTRTNSLHGESTDECLSLCSILAMCIGESATASG